MLAFMRRATCRSCRLIDVLGFGNGVVNTGFTVDKALSVWIELERVSLAALMSLKFRSKVRSSLKEARRELISLALAPGALLSWRTFANDVLESATASCLVSTPVR